MHPKNEIVLVPGEAANTGFPDYFENNRPNAGLAAPSLLVILANAGIYTIEVALLLVLFMKICYFRSSW
jgi:hypothetical protein